MYFVAVVMQEIKVSHHDCSCHSPKISKEHGVSLRGKFSSNLTTIFTSELRPIVDLFLCLFYPAVFLFVSTKLITTWCYILGMRKYTSQITYDTADLCVQKLSLVLKKLKQKPLVGRLGNNGECYSVDKRNNI